MAVPPFHAFLAPCLELHLDGREHAFRDLLPVLAERFQLTAEDMAETIPSGQEKYANRIQWALSYLRAAKLLESPRRAFNRITERGRQFWKETGGSFGLSELERFEEFVAFKTVRPEGTGRRRIQRLPPEELTPSERIRQDWERLTAALEEEVLEAVKALSPRRFERLVVDLMLKLGYGASGERAGEVTRYSGDEGIDGVISEDKLGLDKIYLQAKRHTAGSLGRPEVQAFVGALVGKGASKGVFLTTAGFSEEARRYVRDLKEQKVVLIDGPTLARLMVENGLGVSVAETLEIKRIDRDYFEEEA
ncbi:MAG: restriction endonuclease [Armatimonadetes bacterium]|nr:restriction endonuclease [Armatimonadota bacterium]MCA1997208.1 restriction endonuclease [Armatimonadota bacterium]